MLVSALLFTLIAWDIFGSSLELHIRSFYLLPHYVDWPVHAWVKVKSCEHAAEMHCMIYHMYSQQCSDCCTLRAGQDCFPV